MAIRDGNSSQLLNNDLHEVYNWSVNWEMLFNTEKCSVVHSGKKNPRLNYDMGGTVLRQVEKEKDLGVIMHVSGKVTEQCSVAAIRQ